MKPYTSDWNLIVDTMNQNYHIMTCNNNKQYVANDAYPWHHCLFFVVLEGSDGSTNHSITVCNSYIFDANISHALKYSKEALDWCCSAPGFSTHFARFYRAVYFYPKKFTKFHCIPQRQHTIFGDICYESQYL